jgi:hypothetical protein
MEMDYQTYLDRKKAINSMPSGTKESDALRAASHSDLESTWCQYLMNIHHSAAAKFKQQAEKYRIEREQAEQAQQASRAPQSDLQIKADKQG